MYSTRGRGWCVVRYCSRLKMDNKGRTKNWGVYLPSARVNVKAACRSMQARTLITIAVILIIIIIRHLYALQRHGWLMCGMATSGLFQIYSLYSSSCLHNPFQAWTTSSAIPSILLEKKGFHFWPKVMDAASDSLADFFFYLHCDGAIFPPWLSPPFFLATCTDARQR